MNEKNDLWILEDEASCQFIYEEVLGAKYQLKFFETVAAFKQALYNGQAKPALIVADLKLPDQSFVEFLAQESDISALYSIPFIIVSSMDDAETLRACYEEGALDYLTKPFGKAELQIKIDRLLSKAKESGHSIEAPQSQVPFKIDPMTLLLKGDNGVNIRLTPRELQILSVLQRASAPISRKDIVNQVWGDVTVSSKTLDVHIFNLRKKTADVGVKINFLAPDSFSISATQVA